MTPKTPYEIAGGVNRKEGWALEIAWKMNAPMVNKLISRIIGQTAFNQDLAADVLEILVATEDHLPGLDHITRFLNNVTINVCRDQLKKMDTQENHEDRLIYHLRAMENDDLEIAEADAYKDLLIRQKIARIPGKSGQVFYKYWIEKMTEPEIARQMDMSEKTVMNHLSAGHSFLKMSRQETRRRYAYPLIILLLIYLYETF
jgi:DNA-directed RNA polymerase specialized sigma24 family protein